MLFRSLREKLIEAELDKYLGRNKQQTELHEKYKRKAVEQEPDAVADNNSPATAKFELEIIKLLFEGMEEILDIIFDHILPEELTNKQFRTLATIVLDNYKNDIIAPALLIDKIEDETLRNFVMGLSLNQEVISPKHGEELISPEVTKKILIQHSKDVVKKFKIMRINKQITANNKRLSDTDLNKEIIEILKENKELEDEIKLIRTEELPKI